MPLQKHQVFPTRAEKSPTSVTSRDGNQFQFWHPPNLKIGKPGSYTEFPEVTSLAFLSLLYLVERLDQKAALAGPFKLSQRRITPLARTVS